MSATRIQAVYRDTGVEAYRDNPFIEALPPLQESVNSAASLKSSLQLTSSDLQKVPCYQSSYHLSYSR